MCDIISEFCNICSDYMNKNKLDNIDVYFSNENTYDIIFNKKTPMYSIYHNFTDGDLYSLEGKVKQNNFKIKSAKNSYGTLNGTIEFEKNDVNISLIAIAKLTTDINPYKNLMFECVFS